MGADTPAAGRETKPVVNDEGIPLYHGGRNNANKNYNNNYITREFFLDRTQTFAENVWSQTQLVKAGCQFKNRRRPNYDTGGDWVKVLSSSNPLNRIP